MSRVDTLALTASEANLSTCNRPKRVCPFEAFGPGIAHNVLIHDGFFCSIVCTDQCAPAARRETPYGLQPDARAVCAFDHGLWQWVRLETDPQITSFCEHPVRLGKADDARLIDFWVQRGDSEELLLLDRDRAINKIPESLDGIALRLVPAAELAAAGAWITNWLRMLPVITATRGLVPKSLLRAATNLVREPVALSLVEHELAVGDPSLVRGASDDALKQTDYISPVTD